MDSINDIANLLSNKSNITTTMGTPLALLTQRPCTVATRNMIYSSLYIIVIILVIACNSLVLFKFFYSGQRKRTNIEILIMYLSFFDLFSAIMITADVYENLSCYKNWLFGQIGCKLVFPLYQISLNMSISILLIMSIDRCHSIIMPMKKKFSRRLIHTSVIISLAISILIQWYQFEGLEHTTSETTKRCSFNKRDPKFAIPRIIVLLLRDYTFILIFSVTSALICVSLIGNDFYESYPNRKKDETKRVVVMLIVMELVFSMLVLPYDLFDIIMLYTRAIQQPIKVNDFIKHIDHILKILQMSNSFANCFIYAKMHRYLKLRSTPSTTTMTDYSGSKRGSLWSNNGLSAHDKSKRASIWSNNVSSSPNKFNNKRASLWSNSPEVNKPDYIKEEERMNNDRDVILETNKRSQDAYL